MRLLVKNQKENEPEEPVMPDKEEAKSPFVMKKYETELKQYYFKKERYEEHKAKIFVVVKGQCTLNMKNKVEILQGYDSIEANDDVIKLLNGLKELTFLFNILNAQSAIWILDNMPDSEEGPHNETAGQRSIS
jgi:mannose-6-phosphate isomerase class I